MNIGLWILQFLLAFHTLMGAIWKFSHSAEQTMPSLKAIPLGVLRILSVIEILCALGLVAPILFRSLAISAPVAAMVITIEMLAFCGLHLAAGLIGGVGPMIYWLVVSVLCGLVIYGRLILSPL